MSRTDLLQRVKQRPFIPFRLVLTEGTPYVIRHPDAIMVTRHTAVIGLPGDQEQDFYEACAWVDLMHIVRLEPLDAAAKPGGNAAST